MIFFIMLVASVVTLSAQCELQIQGVHYTENTNFSSTGPTVSGPGGIHQITGSFNSSVVDVVDGRGTILWPGQLGSRYVGATGHHALLLGDSLLSFLDKGGGILWSHFGHIPSLVTVPFAGGFLGVSGGNILFFNKQGADTLTVLGLEESLSFVAGLAVSSDRLLAWGNNKAKIFFIDLGGVVCGVDHEMVLPKGRTIRSGLARDGQIYLVSDSSVTITTVDGYSLSISTHVEIERVDLVSGHHSTHSISKCEEYSWPTALSSLCRYGPKGFEILFKFQTNHPYWGTGLGTWNLETRRVKRFEPGGSSLEPLTWGDKVITYRYDAPFSASQVRQITLIQSDIVPPVTTGTGIDDLIEQGEIALIGYRDMNGRYIQASESSVMERPLSVGLYFEIYRDPKGQKYFKKVLIK